MRLENTPQAAEKPKVSNVLLKSCVKRPPTPTHLTLQRPDAHVLLVQLLLLESDPLQQIIDASVLVLQHHLKTRSHMFFFKI